ncbi:MAG: precorrin-8X methylmutase [Methanoregula sp. PtaU1.Bin051]|nr:MAG: precorrin-8X methylmutase [Methanoregula sp. PtaU1.Bin051]
MMSEEAIPCGDNARRTYIDLGAVTKEAYEISRKSRTLAWAALSNETPEDRIRQRCSIAVGDFAMAPLLRFRNDPVPAMLAALARNVPIFTDIRMVTLGIQKKGHACPITCVLDYGQEMAKEQGITRTSAGFLALRRELNGSIVIIGNAPSSLLSVCRLVEEGIRPAVIIGTPVGFVNAAESKEALRRLDVPSISNEGTRGGTPVAVAAMNECITMFVEKKPPHDVPAGY